MKQFIDAIIIVEGNHDAAKISKHFETNFVITNGYDFNEKDAIFLKKYCKKPIILLTDSDVAGDKIRENILKKLPFVINEKVNINCCNKNGKHGVAECSDEEIFRVLSKYVSTNSKCGITRSDINLLKLDKLRRKFLIETLSLGNIITNKELVSRLNFIDANLQDIVKILNKYGNK